MTTAYTSLLGLALPVQGELSGTWGDVVNQSITSLLDTSVAGTTNVSTDANVTLTTTTGAANTSRQAILLFSGARTAIRTVTAPAQSKIYTVINATTGGFAVTLVGAGPTTGVTIVAGESAVCAWNGSDFVKISNTGGSGTFTNLTVTGIATFSATSGFIVNSAASTSAKFIDIENTSGSLFAGVSSSTGTGIMSSGRAYSAALAGQAGIQFSGNNGTTVHLDLDTSGNLGLGVTPSAWYTPSNTKVMQFGTSGALVGIGKDIFLSNNEYANSAGTDTYLTTGGAALQFRMTTGGQFQWLNAPSGTAGNAITFTQAMTLDASGNLGVGTTSPSSSFGFSRVLEISGTTAAFVINPSNTTSGGGIEVKGAAPLRFTTNNTEAARIDSSGNLLVGTTSALAGARVEASSTGINHTFYRANATGGNTLGLWLSNAYGTATTAAYFRVDGGLANYSANNANLSDARVKTDIKNAGSYLAKICAIPVKTFKYINLENAEDNLGVIAQDVEAIAPELVDVSGFGETPEDGIPLKAIYQTDLQYALMKCIQEMKTIIDDQAARIATLEAK
jgi:hypothetical protein